MGFSEGLHPDHESKCQRLCDALHGTGQPEGRLTKSNLERHFVFSKATRQDFLDRAERALLIGVAPGDAVRQAVVANMMLQGPASTLQPQGVLVHTMESFDCYRYVVQRSGADIKGDGDRKEREKVLRLLRPGPEQLSSRSFEGILGGNPDAPRVFVTEGDELDRASNGIQAGPRARGTKGDAVRDLLGLDGADEHYGNGSVFVGLKYSAIAAPSGKNKGFQAPTLLDARGSPAFLVAGANDNSGWARKLDQTQQESNARVQGQGVREWVHGPLPGGQVAGYEVLPPCVRDVPKDWLGSSV